MQHLVQRFRDGRISVADFDEVPEGMWYKRFKGFSLVGEGDLPKSFLEPCMVHKGQEIK
jgi:hypothetical protein